MARQAGITAKKQGGRALSAAEQEAFAARLAARRASPRRTPANPRGRSLLGALPDTGLTREQMAAVRGAVEGEDKGLKAAAESLAVAKVALRQRLTECGYEIREEPVYRLVAVDGAPVSPEMLPVRDAVLAAPVAEDVPDARKGELLPALVRDAAETLPLLRGVPLTEAQGVAMKRLFHTLDLSTPRVAEVFGVSKFTVLNRLRLVGIGVRETNHYRLRPLRPVTPLSGRVGAPVTPGE